MSGISDNYAYLLVDNALPKTFLPPDKDMQIYTAPEGDKIDISKQTKLIKETEILRNNDKKEFENFIENQKNDIINNYNK